MANPASVLYKDVDMQKVSTTYYLNHLVTGENMLVIHSKSGTREVRNLTLKKVELFKKHMFYVGGTMYLRRKKSVPPAKIQEAR